MRNFKKLIFLFLGIFPLALGVILVFGSENIEFHKLDYFEGEVLKTRQPSGEVGILISAESSQGFEKDFSLTNVRRGENQSFRNIEAGDSIQIWFSDAFWWGTRYGPVPWQVALNEDQILSYEFTANANRIQKKFGLGSASFGISVLLLFGVYRVFKKCSESKV